MRKAKRLNNGNGVQERLLEKACEVFAKKGYRDATVAEICRGARANVAAINYYFGNKETLYAQAWHLAFHRSLKAHPPSGGVPVDAPVEQRLCGRILAIMERLADPKGYEFEIMHKELANPTGLLAEVMRESVEPVRQGLASIVRELLGEKASEEQVMLCQMSIRSQCFDILVRKRHSRMFKAAGMKAKLLPDRLKNEEIADHILQFSLAGIREIRRQIEADRLNGRNSGVNRKTEEKPAGKAAVAI